MNVKHETPICKKWLLLVPFVSLCLVGGMNSGLTTLHHSRRFHYQQRALKTFLGHGYLHAGQGVV